MFRSMQSPGKVQLGIHYPGDGLSRQVKPKGHRREGLGRQVKGLLTDYFLCKLPHLLEADHSNSHLHLTQKHADIPQSLVLLYLYYTQVVEFLGLSIVTGSSRLDIGNMIGQVKFG